MEDRAGPVADRADRRIDYWEAQMSAALEGTLDDPDPDWRPALAVAYRWLVAEARRRRTGEARTIARNALSAIVAAMEEHAKVMTLADRLSSTPSSDSL